MQWNLPTSIAEEVQRKERTLELSGKLRHASLKEVTKMALKLNCTYKQILVFCQLYVYLLYNGLNDYMPPNVVCISFGHKCGTTCIYNYVGSQLKNCRILVVVIWRSCPGTKLAKTSIAVWYNFPPFPPCTSTARPKAVDRITSIVILLYSL